jgi:hypothetical protein
MEREDLKKKDESKPITGDSDFDQTISEHANSTTPSKKKDTTQPPKSDITGLPLSDAIIDKELGTGKIIGKIGSGGMGDVYKIWNEDLGLFRAVKILQRCDNQQLARRFEREIKISAQFDHPNIVRIHATGTWKGYRYLEMEFIDGASLDSWIQKNGKIPPNVCVAIGILIARALHYAHNHSYTLEGKVCKGIIHRDIKPANIMLAKDGKLKIMDFGIARPVGEEIATLTMGVVGSWPYLSPEQIDGCAVDHRADLYAVGAVLYELISGYVAFPDESPKALIASKTRGRYKPLTESMAGLPQGLVKIIDKCLKANPGSRYQSAEELEQDLLDLHKTLSAVPAEKTLESFTRGEAVPPLTIPDRKAKTALIRTLWQKKTALGATAGAILLCFAMLMYLRSMHRVQVLEAPRIFEPRETVKVDPLKTIVKWHAVRNARSYSVLLSSSNKFSDTIFNKQLIDTICPVTALQESRTYYIHIIAHNKRTRAVSNPLCFTTDALPPRAPALVYPGNADTAVPIRPILHWLHGPSSSIYRVQVSLTPDFSQPVCDSNGISDTAYSPANLQEATRYYWRVMSAIDGKNSTWSEKWSFRTKKNDSTTKKSGSLPNATQTDDPEIAAQKALDRGSLQEAKEAAIKIKQENPKRDSLILQIAKKYLDRNEMGAAKITLSHVSSNDMLAGLIKGRIFLNERNCAAAVKQFDASLAQKTRFGAEQVRADIVYYRAKALHSLWRQNKTEYRDRAMGAWKEVWKIYKASKANPRLKEAIDSSNFIGKSDE